MDQPTESMVVTVDKKRKKRIGFLDLSAELRNAIYVLSLTSPEDIPISKHRLTDVKADRFRVCTSSDPQPTISLSINLLQTCKMVHSEATPILYGSNTFVLWMPHRNSNEIPWTGTIGRSVEHLRTVTSTTCVHQSYLAAEWRNLKQAKNLEKLVVHNWWWNGRRQTRGLVKTLRPLMIHLHNERKGTDRKSALDVLEIEGGRWGQYHDGLNDRRIAQARKMFVEMLEI